MDRGWPNFRKKITDDPYGAAVLIRRLVMEQGLGYWRQYLTAFALMAVVAAASAGSTYVLGQVINQAYVNKNVAGIAIALRRHGCPVVYQGHRDLRPHGDPVEDQ